MAPLNIAGPVNLALTAASLGVLLVVGYVFYNLVLHPLRSFPGPLLWRMCPVPRAYWLLRGRLPFKVAELHARYGPAVRIMPAEVAFSSPEAWGDIYGHRKPGAEEFPKLRRFYMASSDSEPHSIIMSGREEHAALRRGLAHGFSEKSMRGQEPIIGSYVDLLIRKLRVESGADDNNNNNNNNNVVGGGSSVGVAGKPVNMREWLNWTTFDVIGDLGFGSAFGCLRDSDYHPWVRLITQTLEGDAFFHALNNLGLRNLALFIAKHGGHKHRKQHMELVGAKMAQRVELDVERPDFMEGLLNRKEELGLTQEKLVRNASTLIIAGSETTATLLCGAVYLLTTHPDKLAKLTAEVRSAFNSEEEITLHSVSRLSYMLACLNETLRCYPPVASGLPRVAPKGGAYVAGKFVPEGTIVAVWQWAVNHDANYWTEPYNYVPERFLGDPKYKTDRLDAMQPFSTGPRNCIGKNLAYAEMRLILARIIWNFDVTLEDDSREWLKDQTAYVLWKKPSLNVRLTPVEI